MNILDVLISPSIVPIFNYRQVKKKDEKVLFICIHVILITDIANIREIKFSLRTNTVASF